MGESSGHPQATGRELVLPSDDAVPGKCSSTAYFKYNWPDGSILQSITGRVVDIGPVYEHRSKFNNEMEPYINIVISSELLDLLQITAWRQNSVDRLLANLILGSV